ncbi:MAG: alpha/beta fold hydrolase [Candidatus Velthaea sp.]
MAYLKRLLRPLLAGAGLAGTVVAINRGLRDGVLPANHLPGTQHRWTWRGHEIFATEAGTGSTVVLVHGVYAGASSFEYRRLFPLLAQQHRVVAFDFLGCGLSDRPNLSYSCELFVEQIVDALAEFGPEPVTLIGSSLGAAMAIRATVRARDRVARLVAICPTGLNGVLDGEASVPGATLKTLVKMPLAGEAFYNGIASRRSLRRFLEKRAYADAASVTPEIVDHYYAVTHQRGARYVPAHFVGGQLNCNTASDLPFVTAPMLVLWGERASAVNPATNAPEYVKLAQDATLVTFEQSGLLPHEEEPEAVAKAIDRFVPAPV